MIRQFNIDNSIKLRIRRIVAIVIFLSLLANVFVSITYLFRNSNYNRVHIAGIKDEEPLDVVFVGGSATFVYWEPLKAWNDYGICSYNYATDTIQAECIKYGVKEVLKYQQPSLFVIDVRAFQYYDEMGSENGLRNFSDSLDWGFDRFRLVKEYLDNHVEEDTDKLPFYLEIMKYHSNYTALGNPANWKMISNNVEAYNKGFEWIPSYKYLDAPADFITEETADMQDEALVLLQDLLEFCKEKSINALFVVCPYQINREHYEKYNTMKSVITSYGFDFINFNNYYEEMELDFSKDFYNGNHVNCFGAEKYTDFLGKYIVENYDMPDHRNEDIYSGWHDEFVKFKEEEAETKEKISKKRQQAEDGNVIAASLYAITDFIEWSALVNDSRFTVLAVGNGEMEFHPSALEKKALNTIGLDTVLNSSSYVKVISGGKEIYSGSGGTEGRYEGIVGVEDVINSYCKIENSDSELSILIDGREYSKQEEGMNIVVFENDYHYVADSLTLKCGDNGKIELVR